MIITLLLNFYVFIYLNFYKQSLGHIFHLHIFIGYLSHRKMTADYFDIPTVL